MKNETKRDEGKTWTHWKIAASMAALSDVITPFENQKTNSYPFHGSPLTRRLPLFFLLRYFFPLSVSTIESNNTDVANGRFYIFLKKKNL